MAAVGTLGGGRDDLEDGRQRHRPGRDPGGRDGDLSAGVDPDRGLQHVMLVAMGTLGRGRDDRSGRTAGSVVALGGEISPSGFPQLLQLQQLHVH